MSKKHNLKQIKLKMKSKITKKTFKKWNKIFRMMNKYKNLKIF